MFDFDFDSFLNFWFFLIETLFEILKKNLDIWGIFEIFLEFYFENFMWFGLGLKLLWIFFVT